MELIVVVMDYIWNTLVLRYFKYKIFCLINLLTLLNVRIYLITCHLTVESIQYCISYHNTVFPLALGRMFIVVSNVLGLF